MHLLIYVIDEQQYGLPLQQVNSAVLAVETTSLPNAPLHILGAINVRGEIIPVINTRKLLGLPLRELKSTDQFILCQFQKRVAIWVDSIKNIKQFNESELIPAERILKRSEGLNHVLKENDQMILLYDLDQLLSIQEEAHV